MHRRLPPWLDAMLLAILGAALSGLMTTLVVGVAFGAPEPVWATAWVWDILPSLRPPLDRRWIPLLGAAAGALLGARTAQPRGG